MKRRGFLGALIGAPLLAKLPGEPESMSHVRACRVRVSYADAVLAGVISVNEARLRQNLQPLSEEVPYFLPLIR